MPEFCNIIKVVQVVIYTDKINIVLSYQNIQDLHYFKSTVGHSRLEWGTSNQWGIVGHIESVGHSEAHQVDGA